MVGVVLDGRYRVEARLARGGMSTVYTGTDLRLDRTVAIKIMSSTLDGNPEFVGRFAREARAAARLSHVNVVGVHDQGADAGHVFLVMELVRGRTLRDLLREHGRLSPELAVAICEPMLAALAASHRAGLIHRDVKPENVLLADDGVVKVADFGLARALADLSATSVNSLVMGTPAYVAPEQITRGVTSPRTDVYSTGIVLFEMLTGGPPYAGESSVSTAYRHVHDDVPSPRTVAPGVPRELADLVVRATRRSPADRPADAAVFLARLHDARTAAHLRRVAIPPRLPAGDRAPSCTWRAPVDDQSTKVHRPAVDAAERRPASTRPAPTTPITTATATATIDRGSGQSDRPENGVRARSDGAHPTLLRAAAPSARETGQGLAGAAPPDLSSFAAPYDEVRRHRRRFLVGLTLLLVLALVAGLGGWWLGRGRFTTVPKLSDLTTSEPQVITHRGRIAYALLLPPIVPGGPP